MIDPRLAEAREGPCYGPFEAVGEAIALLRKETKSRDRKEAKHLRHIACLR
jgi:hypothetical protein